MKFLFGTTALALGAASSAVAASYPFQINTTTPSAVFLRVSSYDNLNGRALQLRTISSPKRQIVVVDANSPVLVSEFRHGTIFSQSRTDTNQRYDLGPVAYLKNVSSHGAQSALQEFYFKNISKTDPADRGFMLEFPSQDAVYSLYHEVPIGVVNGFIACKKKDYYQIYYNRYLRNPPNYKDCTFIGVDTTVAPYKRD